MGRMLKMHAADRAGFCSQCMVDLHNAALASDRFKFIATKHALEIATLIPNRPSLDDMQAIDGRFFDSEAAHELTYA